MWLLPETEIDRLIFEDAPGGDLTTEAMAIGGTAGRLALAARDPMCLAGVEVAAAMMRRLGLPHEVTAQSGDRLQPGAPVIAAEGSAGALHLVWRSAKNMMESLSGIATATRAMVDAAASGGSPVPIALTRKTFPGSRRLSQLAGVAGGGTIHRAGLSETVLVFAEHRAFAPDLPLLALAERLRQRVPERRLAVEVGSVDEARAAIDAGFDVIQLEKFPLPQIEMVAAHAARSPQPPLIAAAGGITPENAADAVRAGAGLIVTSWPYAARPRDLSTHLAPRG